MTGLYATGMTATADSVNESAAGVALPAGLHAQAITGQAFATAGATSTPTGVYATSFNTATSAKGDAKASTLGNASATSVGQAYATGAVSSVATPVGVSAVSNAGTPVAKGAATVSTTAQGASASINQVNATGQATAMPTGVPIYTFVGYVSAANISAKYRALILSGKFLKQISNAEVNTGLKPVVLFEGMQQPRKTNEGVPIVLVNGKLQTLPTGASLIL